MVGVFQPNVFHNNVQASASVPAFGAGPRICIGATFAMAEAHIMLATLLSRFRITLDAARPVLPVARITTAPSYEPSFRLERI